MALEDTTRSKSDSGPSLLNAIAAWPVRVLFTILDVPLRGLQRLLGIRAMPYVFILPNLAQHTTIMNIDSKKFLFFRNLKADLELENGLVLGRRASRA